ncbi:MAG: hypothetical protein AAF908_02960 [Pseudomonadota bacterium]
MTSPRRSLALWLTGLILAIAASPAQALTVTGELFFSNGTEDYFAEVSPGSGDTFDFVFNPFDLNFVTTQSGVFAVPFDGSPVQGVSSSVGSFSFVSGDTANFVYGLTNDLLFAYDNGVTVTFESGTLFDGTFSSSDQVEFIMQDGELPLVSGIAPGNDPLLTTFSFSDTAAAGGGVYNTAVSVGQIPLPATGLLALAAFGGLFFAGRRRVTAI